MNFRALALGTLFGFVVAFAPSCGGSSKCGPNNCNGCCDTATGKCVAKPDNALNTTCGSAGNSCANCSTTNQVCNAATNTCGNVGGGGGAGGGAGGGTGGGSGGGGGGGGSSCTGCLLPGCTPTATNNCCAPGTTTNNCGSGGTACMTCPTGQLCTNQMCQTPQIMKKIGDACGSNADCASLGTGAICKTMTSTGNATYTGGYCTFPCTSTNDPICGTAAFCIGLNPRYGEEDTFCWDKCASGDPCRQPGYACYTVGSAGSGCWLNPLPQQDAGPPADKIGNTCTADGQCQNPPDNGGYCTIRDESLGLVFPGGYCSTSFCGSNEECSVDGGAMCIGFGTGDSRCMKHCLQGGSSTDAGQSDCRTGYLCLSLTEEDGGRTTDGICLPPPAPAPTTVGQACTNTAACDLGVSLADCVTETFPLADGGTTPSGFPGGYCSLFNCGADTDCGALNSSVCLQITSDPNAAIQTACFQSCGAPGQGQSTCRTGYICQAIGQADGGSAPQGYCDGRCDAPGNGCGTGRTCNTSTGYCQ
jgi:hypothetical protein